MLTAIKYQSMKEWAAPGVRDALSYDYLLEIQTPLSIILQRRFQRGWGVDPMCLF